MNKPHSAILSHFRRFMLAVRVFREDPDDVVMLMDQDDGTVHYTSPIGGSGIAQDRQMAMFGLVQMYGLGTGRFATLHDEPPEDGEGGP